MKYKVIKPFLGGSEVGTVLEVNSDNLWRNMAYTTGDCSPIELQLLLDSGYIEEVDGKWVPKEREKVWFISVQGIPYEACWGTDDVRMLTGCYPTESDALKARDAIKECLKNLNV
jgi:hypothetical protein